MSRPFVVLFAGVPGSSKTPIVNHLSYKFILPYFSNDQLRYEVKEDLMVDNINLPGALAEYDKRLHFIRQSIWDSKTSVIMDSSIDRSWPEMKKELGVQGYDWFIISCDYSVGFMAKLYKCTGRDYSVKELPTYDNQHRDFLKKYTSDVGLHLTDADFHNRVRLSEFALSKFVTNHHA